MEKLDPKSTRASARTRPRPEYTFGWPLTARQVVLRQIRQEIMTRRLKPGERIGQDEIAKRLNVSRVPIREALTVLESEGQVTYQPHRGYTVAELSLEELEEIYLMRRLLETEAIGRAMDNIDEDFISRLEGLIREMDQLSEEDDLLGFTEANREFHLALFERAGLPRLFRMIEVLWQTSDAYRSVFFNDPASRHRAQQEHRKIVEACETKDGEALVAAMDEHRSNAIADLAVLLEGPVASAPGE